jgi:hypothetical protein
MGQNRPDFFQGGAPFNIDVGDGEFVVEGFQAGVEMFVHVALPLVAGGIAEEDSAAEGADGMDGAEFARLEGAGAGVLVEIEVCRVGGIVEEGGEFHGGDEEAVAEVVEVAASAGEDADGAADVDLFLEIGVDGVDGGADFGAGGGGEDMIFEGVVNSMTSRAGSV